MHCRRDLEQRWLGLTREALPAVAGPRGWPIRLDHCFMRVLLDHAHGGRWTDHVARRPAYAHVSDAALERAVALGEAALDGTADMAALNRQSLRWRGRSR